MSLTTGVFWLCTLFWGCICFPPQKGDNIARGYSDNERFSGYAGGPQTLDHFHSRESLNTNHDSVQDETQGMRHQSFVSPQQEPVHHENNEGASSVTSEEMVQNKPQSGHKPDVFPWVSSAQKYEHQHPFGLLLKDTQKTTTEGISFATIKDFKRFIETMKRSFLRPKDDVRGHFQTALEIMTNEAASNAQSIEAGPDESHGSNSAKEGTAHDDMSENEIRSESMNAEFESGELGANYQIPNESPSVPDPADSPASLILTTVYDNQDSDPGSAFYTLPHLAAKESNHASFDNGVISGDNHIFTNAPDVQKGAIESTRYEHPKQVHPGSFFGEHFTSGGHRTVPPSHTPAQDDDYYTSETSKLPPLTSEKDIRHTKYAPHSKDSLTVYEKPSGDFELTEGFQGEELGSEIPADVLSALETPPLYSYGKSIYVSAGRGQFSIPDNLQKNRERPAPSFKPYKPPAGKKSNDIDNSPTIHLPLSSSSLSSSSNLIPQSSSGHVGVQLSGPHDSQNQAFNSKQPVGLHHEFNVKRPSSLQGSRRHDRYLTDQRVDVTGPSIPTDQEKNEGSNLSEFNLVSPIQELQQMNNTTLTPISGDLGSTQSGISSPVKADYGNFNSLTNLASPTASDTFSRLVNNEVMPRNSGIKNIIPDKILRGDIHARSILSSFLSPQRRQWFLNSGYVGPVRDGLQHTFTQLTKGWNHPTNVNKEPGIVDHRPPNRLAASKVPGSTVSGVLWRKGGNTKMLPPQTPPVKIYIAKSKHDYARGKVSLSKTNYTPYWLNEDNTGQYQWKPAPKWR